MENMEHIHDRYGHTGRLLPTRSLLLSEFKTSGKMHGTLRNVLNFYPSMSGFGLLIDLIVSCTELRLHKKDGIPL